MNGEEECLEVKFSFDDVVFFDRIYDKGISQGFYQQFALSYKVYG